MRTVLRFVLAWGICCTVGIATSSAVTLPVTENFDASSANWKNSLSNLSQDATWISGGGPGGAGDAFIQSTYTTPAVGKASASQVLFRAKNTVNSSNGQFFGNWIADGVTSLDLWIRQDSGVALNMGLRLPTSDGFPAMLGRFPDPIPSGVWTHLTMAINDTNPQLLDETGPTHNNFNAVFSNVTYLQVFADLSALPVSTTIHVDLDRVHVPEPSTLILAGLGLGGLALARRRRAA